MLKPNGEHLETSEYQDFRQEVFQNPQFLSGTFVFLQKEFLTTSSQHPIQIISKLTTVNLIDHVVYTFFLTQINNHILCYNICEYYSF